MKNVIHILPKAFRRRGVGVALTLLLRAALNFLGLAVLLPVLALVLDPEGVRSGPLARVYEWLGFASPRTFALAVCATVVVTIILKNLLGLWLARTERNYIYDLYSTLSRRLYVTYHARGMSFIKASNSAVLARNVNVVCLAFTAGVLRPAAAIVAEAMLLAMLFGALTVYAPMAALLAAVVFVPSIWIYYRMVRNRINRYGELENRAQREKARLVAETFRGYADIEVNDAFGQMLRAFDRAMDQVVQTRRAEATINLLPQMLTEIGLAGGLALLVAWSLGTGEQSAQLLFGVFAVAALRLMPSVRTIMSSWASIRYNRYTIGILSEAETGDQESGEAETGNQGSGVSGKPYHGPATNGNRQSTPDKSLFRVPTPGEESAARGELLPFDREIAVRNLSFRYDAHSRDIFSGFSLVVRKGERIGIRGTSGAGKTTLINLLLGLYRPTSGTIEIDGTPLTLANRRAWQNRIGYVSQHLFLIDGTFAANVAFGVPEAEIDRTRAAEALEAARLGEFIASLPQGMNTPIGECGCRLSGGQRQRIGIARALYRRADVLIFDEATSELDSMTEQEINRSIETVAARQPGLTLIVIAHRETSLAGCDRIITIGE